MKNIDFRKVLGRPVFQNIDFPLGFGRSLLENIFVSLSLVTFWRGGGVFFGSFWRGVPLLKSIDLGCLWERPGEAFHDGNLLILGVQELRSRVPKH